MIARDHGPKETPFGRPWATDPRCEWCGRSVFARFDGVPDSECDSCRDNFEREMVADKIFDVAPGEPGYPETVA